MPTLVPPFTEPDQIVHGSREVTTRWVLGGVDADGSRPHAVLSVRHVKGQGYRATLNTTGVSTTSGFPQDDVTPLQSTAILDVLTTARFSRTRLDSAYEAALAELRRRTRAGDPAVRAHLPIVPAAEVARGPRSPTGIVASVVDNLVDEDVFSVDGGTTWYVCAVVLFGVVAVYATPGRGDDADTIRVEADRDDACLLMIA